MIHRLLGPKDLERYWVFAPGLEIKLLDLLTGSAPTVFLPCKSRIERSIPFNYSVFTADRPLKVQGHFRKSECNCSAEDT